MKPIHLFYCLLAVGALALGGCSSPDDVGWGAAAGGGGTEYLNATAANGETVRTGSISPEIISATVEIIAKRKASKGQRAVAMKRGSAWSASHQAPVTERGRRYIAVDTQIDARSSINATRSVMIFDTEAQKVAGGNVYDVQTPPPVGEVARFDTYAAQYVGPGL